MNKDTLITLIVLFLVGISITFYCININSTINNEKITYSYISNVDEDIFMIYNNKLNRSQESICTEYNSYNECYKYIFKQGNINNEIELGVTLKNKQDVKYSCSGENIYYTLSNQKENPIICDDLGCINGKELPHIGSFTLNSSNFNYLHISCYDIEKTDLKDLSGQISISYELKNNCFDIADCEESYRCVLDKESEPQINKNYAKPLNELFTCQLDSDYDTILDVVDAFPNDRTEYLDSDGDFMGDNKDLCPNLFGTQINGCPFGYIANEDYK